MRSNLSLSLVALSTFLSITSAAPNNLNELRAMAAKEDAAADYDSSMWDSIAQGRRIAPSDVVPYSGNGVPLSHQFFTRDFRPVSERPQFRPNEDAIFFASKHGVHEMHDAIHARAAVSAPRPAGVVFLGTSTQQQSKYFISKQVAEPVPSLPASLITPKINVQLSTGYDSFNGTGSLTLNADNIDKLVPMNTAPFLSRDAGKGGHLKGGHIFVFCDTMVFTAPNGTKIGTWVGFNSNSITMDIGMNAANGDAVALRDHLGMWSNGNGGQRTFVPFTLGEVAYNRQMQGGRIAIWPSSSILPLNNDTALQFAPLVFINSTAGVQFIAYGVTAYTISIPNMRSGPVAERISNQLFPAEAMEWGCQGGLRSWGASGVGGNDGWVWIFTNSAVGLYAARVPVGQVAQRSAYRYYYPSTGEWSSTIIPQGSEESFLMGSYSSSDIFYSPMHKTFINVYADRYIDNKFLWRYLMADVPLVPTYDGSDFNLNLLKYPWSKVQDLYQAPTPGNGYIYGQGVQMGYFEEDDITNGGNKMLISWTSPTGLPAGNILGGYAFQTAVVTWE